MPITPVKSAGSYEAAVMALANTAMPAVTCSAGSQHCTPSGCACALTDIPYFPPGVTIYFKIVFSM
jgi:hypothetical protein